ncbi:hypothetical protein [Mycobacterium sp. 852002-10029_SCH5224772]|uniref:hypothetical protein n=1 Tax=Mycobacterium sp. 852002-10029_SCH5224772 TaxID=1834083 RepID=UPI000AB3ECCF|nr:hypothetical protein [Mycobacterium sp. 852002-10029_SCH5224772]
MNTDKDRTTMPYPSQPVLWWQLINEAEAVRSRYNLGLASVWMWIHRNNYKRARAALDEVVEVLVPLRQSVNTPDKAREMKDART